MNLNLIISCILEGSPQPRGRERHLHDIRVPYRHHSRIGRVSQHRKPKILITDTIKDLLALMYLTFNGDLKSQKNPA